MFRLKASNRHPLFYLSMAFNTGISLFNDCVAGSLICLVICKKGNRLNITYVVAGVTGAIPSPLSKLLFSRRNPKVSSTCWPQRLSSRTAEHTCQIAQSHQFWDCRLPLTRVKSELCITLYSDLI